MSKFKKCGTGCGRTLTAKNVRRLRVLDESADYGILGDVARDNRNKLKQKGAAGLEGWARINRPHMKYICSDCFDLIKPKDLASETEKSIDVRRDGFDKEGMHLIDPTQIKIVHNPKHEDYTLLDNE